MFKSILVLCLAALLFSCGADVSVNESESKYSLEMVDTGEKIASNNGSYSGSGTEMKFVVGDKGELYIYDLYSKLSGVEITSFEGKTFPGMVMFNDAKFDGVVLIEKIQEEQDVNKSSHGKNYNLKGTFTATKGNKIKFAVSLFRMN